MPSAVGADEPERRSSLPPADIAEPRPPESGIEQLLRQNDDDSKQKETHSTADGVGPVPVGAGPIDQGLNDTRFRGLRAFMTQMSTSAGAALSSVRERSPKPVGGFMNRFRRDRAPLSPRSPAPAPIAANDTSETAVQPNPTVSVAGTENRPPVSAAPIADTADEPDRTERAAPSVDPIATPIDAPSPQAPMEPIPMRIPRRSLPRLKRSTGEPTTIANPPPSPTKATLVPVAIRPPSPRRRRTLTNGVEVHVDTGDVLSASSEAPPCPIPEPLTSLMHYRRGQQHAFQHLSVAYVESKADGSFHRVPATELVRIGVDHGDEQTPAEGLPQRKGDNHIRLNLGEERLKLSVVVLNMKHIAHGLLAGVSLILLLNQWRSVSYANFMALYSPVADIYHGLLHACTVITLTGQLHLLDRNRILRLDILVPLLLLFSVFVLNLVTTYIDEMISNHLRKDALWYTKQADYLETVLWMRLNYARTGLGLVSWIATSHAQMSGVKHTKASISSTARIPSA